MKASELIELLKKEIEICGDNEMYIHADLGVDEEGVHRVGSYSNISVNTGGSVSTNGAVLGFVTIINCKK